MDGLTPIVAIASPTGSGAIGIIRISGQGVHEIVQQYIKLDSQIKYRYAYYKNFYKQEQSIDDVVALFYQGPSSYTGEDMVELFTHASPYIMQEIVSALCVAGARQAEAGEFTKRAFVHGKLDLNQAEGIAQTIAVESEQQLIAAKQLTSGKYSKHIIEIRSELIQALAYLEARIDFPDEGETSSVEMQQACQRLELVRDKVMTLVKSYENGKVARSGLKILLLGSPNSGKSTLLNHFLGYDRAIVSDIAGTTRDFIEESCLLDGRLVRFIDTAGIRDSVDPIEKQGIQRSLGWVEQADLILYLSSADALEATKKKEKEFLLTLKDKKILSLNTKVDLVGATTQFAGDLPVSIHQEDSLTNLKKAICDLVDQKIDRVKNEVSVSSKRHYTVLKQSYEQLSTLLKSSFGYDECLAYEVQQVVKNLDEIVGTIDNEDILERIFTQFCIGK